MVEYTNRVTEVVKAISDPTRRSLLLLLSQQGPVRVTELASHYEMSLNAISKHIKILEAAKLVKRTTIGRIHLIEADLTDIALLEQWLTQLQSIWSARLDALDLLITQERNDND